jgi:hypothetical protein
MSGGIWIKSAHYDEMIKVKNQPEDFGSFIQPDVLLTARSYVRSYGHIVRCCFVIRELLFNISANALEIRAIQSPLSDVLLTVRTTAHHAIHLQFDTRAHALEVRAEQSPKCVV